MNMDEPTVVQRVQRYRFGAFELDLDAYALTRAGVGLPLRRKAFDVLQFLIEHRERVVTKTELLDAIWTDSQVAEVAVPWTVCHARRVLGQTPADKSPIETVHGRGYRFVAEVESISARAIPSLSEHNGSAQASALRSPLVGRQHVMALLQTRLAEASMGRGSLTALVGDAGIGKTRCVEELAVRARDEGLMVWRGRSAEDTVAPVYWPWIQVLRDIVRDRPTLRDTSCELLARLVGSGPTPAISDLHRAPESFWLLDGMCGLLRAAAREGPALIVIEDLHWADQASIHLLAFIAADLHEQATLVVTTERSFGGMGTKADLRRLSRHTAARIELEPLTPDEVGEYLELVANTREVHAELSAALHHATAGNPLFLLQTVNDLIERHGLDNVGVLRPELVEPALSARDVLRSGLDALDERAQRVLEVASVLGEHFELSTLQALCGLEVDELLGALEAASSRGLVLAEEPNHFRFRHALLRTVLYDQLTAPDRATQHRRAAHALERSGPDRPRHEQVAHHYYRSLELGDHARVARAAEQAAQAAARLSAFSDAASFCRWAVEAQALEQPPRPRPHAELLRLLARYEQLAGNGQDAARTLALLVEIAGRHGYTDLLLDAARIMRPTHRLGSRTDPQVCAILEDALRTLPPGAEDLRIQALSQLSWTPPYALDVERSKELSTEALALARQRGCRDSLLIALHAQLYAFSGPGDIDALLTVTEEILRSDRLPRTSTSLDALSARHAALIYRGDMVQAEATHATFGYLAREQKWPEAIWTADRLSAQRKLLEGDFAAAELLLRELGPRSRRLRLRHGAALCAVLHSALTIQRDGPRVFASRSDTSHFSLAIHDAMPSVRPGIGRLCASLGQHAAAKSVLESTLGTGGFALPKEATYLNAVASLGVLAIALADRPRAARIYEELAPYPHHNTPDAVALYEGSVSFFLAGLAAFLGMHEHVARHFDDALAMNEQLGMRPQVARTYVGYARWRLGRAHGPGRKVGLELRSRAIELAEELGMSWLAQTARSAQ